MRIYNSATRCKERFRPVGDPVRLYACGPTVYAPAHLGHAKSYVAIDVLRRWLEYRGHAVRHAQNITDIADETAQMAVRDAVTEAELTARYESEFLTQMDALGNLKPHALPRASEVAERIGVLTARLLLKTGPTRVKTESGSPLRKRSTARCSVLRLVQPSASRPVQ